MKALRYCVSAVVFSVVLAQGAVAQEFPSKPITIIVNYGAGGPTDLPARKLASLLEKSFNQAVVVENKTGGGGVVGLAAVAKAAPDGYTFGTFSYSPTVVASHVRSVPYSPTKDFTPLIQIADYAQPLCVQNETPWKTVSEVVAFAKANPGAFSYSTVGAGSGQHVFMEGLAKREGVKFTHVPFTGGAQGIAALLGGHVKGALDSALAKHAKSGECRPLAVMGEQRLATLPDVPTFAEQGFKVDAPLWLGFAGPAGIPAPIVKKLETAMLAAAKDPSFTELLHSLLLTPVVRGSAEFSALVAADDARMSQQIKDLGLATKN